MDLKELKETFYTFSGKTSDASRQLAFSGIAAIWVFAKIEESKILISKSLSFSLLLFVTSLLLDLVQYAYAASKYDKLHRKYELKNKKNFNIPIEIKCWISCFYKLKLLSLGFGYLLFAYFIFDRIKF
jgi:hypothetical protein